MSDTPGAPPDCFDGWLKTYRSWVSDLARASEPARRIQQQLESQLVRFKAGFEAWSEQPATKEMFRSLRDTIVRVQQFPELFQKQLIALAQHGWYIDPEMTVTGIRSLHEAFQMGAAAKAQELLEDYYRQHLDAIEARLLRHHPERAQLLSAAFNAHRAGSYLLSIPVMLIQADGIASHERGRQLYSANPGVGIPGLIDDLGKDDFNRHLWEVFRSQAPLTLNTKKLPEDFSGLNRHKVLHGVDCNYASETNALRAVSLLNFASFALADRDGVLQESS